MSQVGHSIDLESTKAVTSLRESKPKNVGEVRKLTGLLSYYRRYIQHFSRIAKPLYDLLKEPERKGPLPQKSQSKDQSQPSRRDKYRPASQSTRQASIKQRWSNSSVQSPIPPVMAYPDYTKPFILHTDASERGLGAALFQKQDGQLQVIAYGSRTLTPAERNYHLPSSKLEFPALKWAISEQFRDYLYYAPYFTVYTDNNPLTSVLTTAKLNATGHPWVAELSDFHFTVKHRPGMANKDADSLSRIHSDIEQYMDSCTEQVDPEWIKATVEEVDAQQRGEAVWLLSLSSQPSELKHIMGDNCGLQVQPLTPKDLYEAQRGDNAINTVIQFKISGKPPTLKRQMESIPKGAVSLT